MGEAWVINGSLRVTDIQGGLVMLTPLALEQVVERLGLNRRAKDGKPIASTRKDAINSLIDAACQENVSTGCRSANQGSDIQLWTQPRR